MGRCQSKDIVEQFDAGARLFDLRVSFNKGIQQFSHGLLDYKGDVFELLALLNLLSSNTLYVRVLLEKQKFNDPALFRMFCCNIKYKFPYLTFIGGRDKKTWELLYSFGTKEPTLDDKYASMTGKKWDDLWPWLYARLNNRRNIAEGTDKEFMMIDFVEIK